MDPGLFLPLDPGSEIFSESLKTVFRVENTSIFDADPESF
jgi:hypothetical protein